MAIGEDEVSKETAVRPTGAALDKIRLETKNAKRAKDGLPPIDPVTRVPVVG